MLAVGAYRKNLRAAVCSIRGDSLGCSLRTYVYCKPPDLEEFRAAPTKLEPCSDLVGMSGVSDDGNQRRPRIIIVDGKIAILVKIGWAGAWPRAGSVREIIDSLLVP